MLWSLFPDCTVGRHLILVLPGCVLSPAPAAPEPNASCSLEKLTSDPGVYAVPLVGCGVAKHVGGVFTCSLGLKPAAGLSVLPSPIRCLVTRWCTCWRCVAFGLTRRTTPHLSGTTLLLWTREVKGLRLTGACSPG